MSLELGIISVGTIVGGIIIGVVAHFLSKSREKEGRIAKDFNEAADPLSVLLENEKEAPSTLGNIDFSAFRRVLSDSELKRFDKLVKDYETAKNNAVVVSDSGDIIRLGGSYKDITEISASVEKLLKFTKRK